MKITLLLLLTAVSANNLRETNTKEYNTIPCKEMEHAKCLKWNNASQSCSLLDCWGYDQVEGCTKTGKGWVPALILQCIPFTGVFGSGFGNIGRWDIFTMYMAACFGPPLLMCVVAICYCFCCPPNDNTKPLLDDDDKSTGCHILSLALGCVWGILLVVLWIWGIVTIAEKGVMAPWVSSNGTKLMCPMV